MTKKLEIWFREEIDGVIRFSWAQQISPTKIHLQLIVVYIDHILACHKLAQIFRKSSKVLNYCDRGQM